MDLDFDGRFFKLNGVRAKPKPYGGTRPLIMNAGASATGQAFAIRNCDALFSTIWRGISFEETARHVRDVRALAQQSGREIDVYTVGVVTCRSTAREAQDYYRHAVIHNADWPAVDNTLRMKNITPQSHWPKEFQRIRDHQANGMGGLSLVGDPDAVAQDMTQLAALGLKGIAVSFVNYARNPGSLYPWAAHSRSVRVSAIQQGRLTNVNPIARYRITFAREGTDVAASD
jgi:alkanesulfonate monooxygenase SsuD/methylene tetrahydromethanopterin reductase-like flavin-dependent oxidoreductase (luciferase family)